jgi:hypothetical protein
LDVIVKKSRGVKAACGLLLATLAAAADDDDDDDTGLPVHSVVL